MKLRHKRRIQLSTLPLFKVLYFAFLVNIKHHLLINYELEYFSEASKYGDY